MTAKARRYGRIRVSDDSAEIARVPIRRAELGGEQKSAGTNSSTSTEAQPPKDDSESPSLRPPVPTTENPSAPPEKAQGSTARSTVGGGQKTTQPRSGSKATKNVPASKKARMRST